MIVSLITKRKEMKNNFTKSQIYQNEATLFINPSKKQKAKANKPKLLISFIIVLIIFSSILTFSTLASNSENSWTVWYDDDYEFTYIDAWSSEGPGLMTLTINNNNCDNLAVNFFIPSDRESIAEDWTRFIVEVTETPYKGESWQEYKNVVFINFSEIQESGVIYVLGFDTDYETKDWINRLESHDPFHFHISISEHADEQADPKLYFEYTNITWDMGHLKSLLGNAYRDCRFKSYHEIAL